MTESVESRQFARRPFIEDIFCYVDGERLDARSVDLSVGGVFLQTDRGLDVPVGAVVAVVLKNRVETEGTIFLFGKVVRCQPGERSGFGVRWEKAVGPVVIAMIGGSGTVLGPLVGALLIEVIREFLRFKTQYLALTIYGIMLILVGLFIPGGLMRLRRR